MFPEVDTVSPLLQNLNPEQQAAVTLPDEHALIGAGSHGFAFTVFSAPSRFTSGRGCSLPTGCDHRFGLLYSAVDSHIRPRRIAPSPGLPA